MEPGDKAALLYVLLNCNIQFVEVHEFLGMLVNNTQAGKLLKSGRRPFKIDVLMTPLSSIYHLVACLRSKCVSISSKQQKS